MKVAAIQMVSGTRIDDNLRDAHALLLQAAQAGAELAVLPEYFCVMGQRDTDKLALQELLGKGPIQDWLAATARELGLWIVGGTLPLSSEPRDEARVRNASLAFNPQGERVACYDKIHLFQFDDGTRIYDEAAVLARGSVPTLFELPSRDGHTWRIGMSVCYDLRFPELYRAYAAQGGRRAAGAERVHLRDGAGALGGAAAGAGDREPGGRDRGGAGGHARERAAHLGPQHGGGCVGAGAGLAG